MSTTAVCTESPTQRAAFFTSKAHDFAQRAAASFTDAGRAYNESQAAKYLRIAQSAQSRADVATVAQPEPVAAPVKAVPVKPEPTRRAADACRVRIMRA